MSFKKFSESHDDSKKNPDASKKTAPPSGPAAPGPNVKQTQGPAAAGSPKGKFAPESQ